jgi:hypothetical protein
MLYKPRYEPCIATETRCSREGLLGPGRANYTIAIDRIYDVGLPEYGVFNESVWRTLADEFRDR